MDSVFKYHIDYVECMENNHLPKQLINGKPGGARGRGRPRMRWLEDVEADQRQLGVRRWRAANRPAWQVIGEEAHALGGH